MRQLLKNAEKELEEKHADLMDSLQKKDEAYKEKASAEAQLDDIGRKEEIKEAADTDQEAELDRIKAESKVAMMTTINTVKAG